MRKPGKIDCNVFVSPTQQIHILVQVHEAMWSEEHLAQAARKEPAFPMLIQTAVHWTASRRWMHRKAEQDECTVWQHGFVDPSQSIENQQIVHSNAWFVHSILLTHRPV